jgi:molybdenum ABC transporter molybdate-binding protein
MTSIARRISALVAAIVLLCASVARGDEIRVLTSGAFQAALVELAQEFERVTRHTVVVTYGASMGNSPDSIPNRLQRGEPIDVVIQAASGLEDLIKQGKVVAGSRVDLVRSSIGMAVRAGAPKPDISTVDALKQTLLRAKSVAYSSSASGVYLSSELFPRLGIADQVTAKSRRVESGPVAVVVARGEAEIGFQQISELLPVQGIDYVGPLPSDVQRVTIFSAGVTAAAKAPDAARALITFLASPAAFAVIRKSGLEPMPAVENAQGTPADYARAVGLRARYEAAAVDIAGTPTAIGRTHHFWYRKSVKGGDQFVIVDADTQQKRPAFDHEQIAQSLSKASGNTYTALRLPFNNLAFTDDGSAFTVNVDGSAYRCTVADSTCRKVDGGLRVGAGFGVGRRNRDEGPRVSPDGKWEAIVNNHNVAIRQTGARLPGTITRLSTDGSEGNYYELSSIAWSPDSKKIAAHRVRPGYRREVHYVESSPEDQLQPKHSTLIYAKPGDVLDVDQPVLFVIDTRQQIVVDNSLFPNAYANSALVWRADSRAFTFEYNQRGHQVYRIIEVDGTTGKARAVISEEPKTFFNYRTANGSLADSGKKFRYDHNDGKDVIWMSERDGWNHLYLIDGVTGRVKNQITKGDWVVRGVQHVDPAARQIWFSAGGMYPGKDPYFANYYRINFDGSGLTRLTEADANHTAALTSDMKFYVDTYSRIDLAPVVELRRAADNALLATLERGDITELGKTGWKAPEVFVSKARDGKTDIWGVIVRPSNFDPSKTYPVIENIYAGPQGSFVPKSFAAYNQMMSQAELGFIVVQIDGMGTSNRSKAFHDVAWQNLGDAGFPDRILWHKAVAAKYPYYDVTRVGIYGGSAGGQNALGGLLFHPEFYKSGIAYAGCHDNRMDKIWWNEQWMGWPIGPQYSASSNVDNAYRLQGDLLLVVGELDTNVDPSSTMQVANQLIKHNKNFDLLVVPGANHPAGRGNDPTAPYGDHKRFDFFVQHLLGVNPPPWNRTEARTSSDASRPQ